MLFTVISAIRYNGKRHSEGSRVEMDPNRVAHAVAKGRIAPVPAKAPKGQGSTASGAGTLPNGNERPVANALGSDEPDGRNTGATSHGEEPATVRQGVAKDATKVK